MHAEPVLLVDDGERQIAEHHLLLEERVRSHHDIERSRGQGLERGPPLARLVPPGEQGDAHAGLGRHGRDAVIMLAGQDFGRRHHRGLPPGLDSPRHRKQTHDRLAAADIALEQPQHAVSAAHVGRDVLQRLLLSAGEREGQGSADLTLDPARSHGRPADGALHPRPDHDDGELVRQQFVICQPLADQAFRREAAHVGRVMHGAHRIGEGGPAAVGEEGGLLPLRHRRQARQRATGNAADQPAAEAFRQRIDRFDRRQQRELALVHHPVRMNHLAKAVEQLDLARKPARLTDGQHGLDLADARIEEHDLHVGALVRHEHAEGRSSAWRRRAVGLHLNLYGDDLAVGRIAQQRPHPPIDAARRQMHQQVNDARGFAVPREQALEQGRHLGADAGNGAEGREQGIEKRGTHRINGLDATAHGGKRGGANRVTRPSHCDGGRFRKRTRRRQYL